jgi:hypothetical protein
MFGKPKSKSCFCQNLPTSLEETLNATSGKQMVSCFDSGCGFALNFATLLGSSARIPINVSQSS